MNFAKDMVAEQETLLRALNERHLENKVVKKIGTEMATKMDTLKSHLKVMKYYITHFSLKLCLLGKPTMKILSFGVCFRLLWIITSNYLRNSISKKIFSVV